MDEPSQKPPVARAAPTLPLALERRARGVSAGGVLSLAAVLAVLVLVSLPRLQAFALEENETDAAALTRVLGRALAQLQQPAGAAAPAPTLAEVARAAGLDGHRDDVEWVDAGRVLRRHGYLFELCPRPGGAVLRAWPWAHGDTGRAAFVFRPAEGVLRHGNPAGAWTGPGRPPAGDGAGWLPVAEELDPAAF